MTEICILCGHSMVAHNVLSSSPIGASSGISQTIGWLCPDNINLTTVQVNVLGAAGGGGGTFGLPPKRLPPLKGLEDSGGPS